MNRSIFWRLFWKEYRLQRAVWMFMAVLAWLVMLFVVKIVSPLGDESISLFSVAVAFSCLYCLGCGATLFAGEYEADTYEFQRGLPVRAKQVFLSKIAFALVSSLLLFVLMWSLAAFLSDWTLRDAYKNAVLGAVLDFFGLEVLLWTVFFSLLSSRVLVAAILGAAAASVSVHLITTLVNAPILMSTYAATMPCRMIVAAIVAVADFWLGVRWFHQRRQQRLRSAEFAIHAETPVRATAFSDSYLAPDRTTPLGRLVWQYWRQSMGTVLVLLGALLVSLVVIVTRWLNPSNLPMHVQQLPNKEYLAYAYDSVLLYGGILPALVGVALLGLCAFQTDRWGNSFRFLADHGVQPRHVWLSRQLVALMQIAWVFFAFLLLVFFLASGQIANGQLLAGQILKICGYVLIYAFLAMTVGQFCSMLFHSGILAGIFSILLASLLMGWCGLMLLWSVPWLWSVLPIPLALLLATRLRTPYLLLDQNTPRSWFLPALVLVVPAAAILIAVPLYRVYEIPEVDPGFSPEEYARPLTPEELSTYELYRLAIKKLEHFPRGQRNRIGGTENVQEDRALALTAEDIAWVDANRESIDLAMQASHGKLFFSENRQFEQFGSYRLTRLLLYSANNLEKQGKLDAALDQYLALIRISRQLRNCILSRISTQSSFYIPDRIEVRTYACLAYWATRPGQTPERVTAAARQLEQLTSEVLPSLAMKLTYLIVLRNIEDERYATAMDMFEAVWLRLPWERQRALRLLKYQTLLQLEAMVKMERAARHDQRLPWSANHSLLREPDLTRFRPPKWIQALLYGSPIIYDLWLQQAATERDYTAMETSRDAIRLILALEAWKLKHGSLPKSLDELVGPYLSRIPNDPYSGQPFRYFPDGLKTPLQWSQPTRLGWNQLARYGLSLPTRSGQSQPIGWNQQAGGTIAPNRPFIWSTGAKISHQFDALSIDEDSDVNEGLQENEQPIASLKQNVGYWELGWPFLVP